MRLVDTIWYNAGYEHDNRGLDAADLGVLGIWDVGKLLMIVSSNPNTHTHTSIGS